MKRIVDRSGMMNVIALAVLVVAVPSMVGASDGGDAARVHIKSLRMLTDAMNVFACEPRNDLLSDRQPNEAYCLAEPGRQYAVYFPDGGAVTLDVSAAQGPLEVRWLDISRSAWQKPQTTQGGGTLELQTPGKGQWAVLVESPEMGLGSLVIRPDSRGIKPSVSENAATFTMPAGRCQLSFEPDGRMGPQLLLANRVERDAPKPTDSNVRYFGPGLHQPGEIFLGGNQNA